MVRLKAEDDYYGQLQGYNFNSSMVRLKASAIFLTLTINEFQFQYGAIKRLTLFYEKVLIFTFQFQYGAIKSNFLLLLTVV